MTQINQNRAIISDTQTTVYGYYVGLRHDQHWILTYEGERFQVDPDTVCRNTYVKDYKGSWVYEHDAVVSAPSTNQKDIATIIFKKGCFYFRRGGNKCDITMDTYVSEDRLPFFESLGDARKEINKEITI